MTSMPPDISRSIHEPFSWLPKGENASPAAIRNADAMDAFRGIQTCLELVEMSNLDREMADPHDPDYIIPTLSVVDTGRLFRLALLVAKEWGTKAERDMSKHKMEGGQS